MLADGALWDVQPAARKAVEIHSAVVEMWSVPASDDLVFDFQGFAFFRYGAGGVVWHTRRLSWDGFRKVRIDSHVLAGEAWAPFPEEWRPFTVDLETGASLGGNYAGPDEQGWEKLAREGPG